MGGSRRQGGIWQVRGLGSPQTPGLGLQAGPLTWSKGREQQLGVGRGTSRFVGLEAYTVWGSNLRKTVQNCTHEVKYTSHFI